MVGKGPYAWMIGRRFEIAPSASASIKTSVELRTDLFTRPSFPASSSACFKVCNYRSNIQRKLSTNSSRTRVSNRHEADQPQLCLDARVYP